jgi:type VI secretion system secreted protein VgrG
MSSATGGPSAGAISAGNALAGMAQTAMQKGIAKAGSALKKAAGADASGAGGESDANEKGPEGAVDGSDETDRGKGPGHDQFKVGASHDETVAALKVAMALNGVNTNVTAAMERKVGAAHLVVTAGTYAESCEGNKSETALGLVVLSKSDESETVTGDKKAMVGGAVLQKIAGGHSVTAGAGATFVGAFQKMEASGTITFKCGGSTVVIDGGGVTMQSVVINVGGKKIQLPKDVSEVV